MKLGISTYTLTWSFGVPGYDRPHRPLKGADLIRIAQQNGLELVQFADNYALHQIPEQELKEMIDLAKRANVQIEVGTRGTDPQHLIQYLKICVLTGAPLLRTLITTDDMEQAEKDLRIVLPEFKKVGVAIAIENHGLHTVDQLTELFNRIDEPSIVGCCLDTVNSFGALESPREVIQALSPYTLNLHIKDFDITRIDHQMGFEVLGTPAGKGRLHVPELIDQLHRCNKNPNAILELWTPYQGSVEQTIKLEQDWLTQSLAYLKNVI